MANVLVTGGGGYIGNILTGQLLNAGYKVTILDWFAFGKHLLGSLRSHPGLSILNQDIRTASPDMISGFDVICDLAALSNDPCGDLEPELTRQINYHARARLGRMAKAVGVRRYLLASSCSVYGVNGDEAATEESRVSPITTYAECNVMSEEALFAMSDSSFSVTSLRNSTAFGLSPRMRFDLVINIMTLNALRDQKILIHGDGQQHRPFIHIADISRAFIKAMQAPVEAVEGQIFNLGCDNMKISDLADIVSGTLPFDIDVSYVPDNADKRDYTVSFDKVRDRLGFEPEISIRDGVMEIYFAILTGRTIDTPETRTVERYKEMIASGAQLLQAAGGGME